MRGAGARMVSGQRCRGRNALEVYGGQGSSNLTGTENSSEGVREMSLER